MTSQNRRPTMKDNQAKYPQLRFKGFTDPWEQRKLGNLGLNISDGDWIEKQHIFENGQYRIIQTGNIGVDEYLDKPQNAKYFRQEDFNQLKANEIFPGDIVVCRLADPAGRAVILPNIGKQMVTSVDVAILRPSSRISFRFLVSQLNNPRNLKQVQIMASGSTRTRISRKNLEREIIQLPNINEQKKIGSFFSILNSTIALHQRKLAKLKELKQGYLQKLFPKNGSKFPQLRFAGFADAWEERKFKDNIVSIQTGTNLLGSAVNEGTPLIKMGNLQRGYFSFKKLEYLDSNSNVGSEDIVNYGDFLFNTRNTLELVGKGATWTGISGKYAFNSNIARFKFDGIDTIFFNYLYNTQQVISQVHARAVGTTSVSAVYPRDLNSLLYYFCLLYTSPSPRDA